MSTPVIDPVMADAVVIVTGGSWGAGRDLVPALARRGFAVVLVYLRDQGEAEAIVEEVLAAGGTAVAIRADVTDELDVERVFDETTAAFGDADLVIHAGRRGAAVVFRHAERRLRPGGTTVRLTGAGDVARVLAFVDRWRLTPGA